MPHSEFNDSKAVTERSLSATINLYYDLQTPETAPAPLLIALHGYGASKRQMMREARSIAPAGFGLVSLQGPHQHIREPKEPGGPLRFGFGWLTNFRPEESVAIHHRALLDLIESLANEGVADRQRIFLLGFSQSCALNYRFAFTHPNLLRGVIGICGGTPGDWETSGLYKQTRAGALHLSGERDEFYPPERTVNYGAQLRERSPDVECRSYDAAHEIVQPMRDDIRAWLEQRTPD
jgi:phospholipase/carboxylesterase